MRAPIQPEGDGPRAMRGIPQEQRRGCLSDLECHEVVKVLVVGPAGLIDEPGSEADHVTARLEDLGWQGDQGLVLPGLPSLEKPSILVRVEGEEEDHAAVGESRADVATDERPPDHIADPEGQGGELNSLARFWDV